MKLKRVLDGFRNFGPEDAVNLSDCSLDDAAFLPLLRCGAFPFKKLLLDNNNLTDRAATSLATVLCLSPTVSTLSLRANKVGDCAAKALSRWVETTKAGSLELDLRGTEVKDDGVDSLCVAARRTFRPSMKSLRLERMGLQGLGGIVDFLESPVSTKLESLHCTVVDLDTLHTYREEVTSDDFDTANYAKPKEDTEGEEREDDEAVPNEELRKRLEDEAESVGEESFAAPPSPELLRLVERFVKAVEHRSALVDVEVLGIPERYSDEIRWIIADRTDESANAPKKSFVESLSWERDLVTDMVNELTQQKGMTADTRISPNISLRSYIGRTLDASLGDALFECQWHKAMGNQAVADSKGEMAFIARFLRHALKKLVGSDYIEKTLAEDRVVNDGVATKEKAVEDPIAEEKQEGKAGLAAEKKQDGEAETLATEHEQKKETETTLAEQQEVETGSTEIGKKGNADDTVEAKGDYANSVADTAEAPANLPAHSAAETAEVEAIPDEVVASAP